MFKKGDMVECVDKGGKEYLTVGKHYEVDGCSSKYVWLVVDDAGSKSEDYYNERFKKVNKPKQEKAKGDCMMIIFSTIIVTRKDGIIIAAEGEELSVADSKGKAFADRLLKSSGLLKGKPNKEVMVREVKFQSVE